MKKFFLLVTFNLILWDVYSTNQVEDVLFFNGYIYYLYESPLFQIDQIENKINSLDSNLSISSACWRGFKADWIIRNDSLYLLKVCDCHWDNKLLNHLIENILNEKFINGQMFANWVNGDIWCGKNLSPRLTFFSSVYRNEIRFVLKKGLVQNIKTKNYIPCEYSDEEKLNEFIFNNIDWKRFPELKDTSIIFSASILTNNVGEISDIQMNDLVGYGYKKYIIDTKYQEEYIRVLKLVPCWEICFQEGYFFTISQTIEITINKENIKKYVR